MATTINQSPAGRTAPLKLLPFYRDSNGNEVDLLLNYGPDLFPMKIKAGMTLNNDYFKGLRAVANILDLPLGTGLLYGGNERQQRRDIVVRPARKIHLLLAEMVNH